jgi:hypothetical protein
MAFQELRDDPGGGILPAKANGKYAQRVEKPCTLFLSDSFMFTPL